MALSQLSSGKFKIKNHQEHWECFLKYLACQSLICLSLVKQTRFLTRVHSKGLGVICVSPQGIPVNTKIGEYFGELYPVWLWHRTQAFVKSLIYNRRGPDVVQDFFNITVVKHPRDNAFLSSYMIDPIQKGNLCSRLSHSCKPNCFIYNIL